MAAAMVPMAYHAWPCMAKTNVMIMPCHAAAAVHACTMDVIMIMIMIMISISTCTSTALVLELELSIKLKLASSSYSSL
jgi:hypothetical protein